MEHFSLQIDCVYCKLGVHTDVGKHICHCIELRRNSAKGHLERLTLH